MINSNTNRFEVNAAFIIGLFLPILETLRRGIDHWLINFTTMFEDYLAGGILLIAWWASRKSLNWAPSFQILAWAYLAGLAGSSLWWHAENTIRGLPTEPHNLCVLLFKAAGWILCIVCLTRSFQRTLILKIN